VKVLLTLLLVVVVLAAAAALAVGWVMSNRFLVPKPYSLMPEFEIVAVEGAGSGDENLIVSLPLAEGATQFSATDKEGIYNLLWRDGHGRLGEILSEGDDIVKRRLTDIVGEAPRPGNPARLDVTIFRRDPLADHGIPFEELWLDGTAGRLRAWWIHGDGERAVLALHGRRRADLSETMRILPTLVAADWSVLAVAYRNHDASDPSRDGLFHYGSSEADDALEAVEELSRRGVEVVVLYGFSMGGAVALEAARRWPEDGPRLAGIVLDSPLLDPRTVIAKGARDAGLPMATLITDLSLSVARFRTGVDWDSLDQRRWAGEVRAPMLLFAGTADHTIPIELVDDFASRIQAPLEYLRLKGVDHVEGWNRDRLAYEQSVAGFLDLVSTPEAPRSRP
jgi:pimeloyl-ACP methyl ester carboxylesterase